MTKAVESYPELEEKTRLTVHISRENFKAIVALRTLEYDRTGKWMTQSELVEKLIIGPFVENAKEKGLI